MINTCERERGRERTNGAVHFKLHRISVHLIQRYWGLVLKQDSFNASSAGLIRLMNGGPWKDQKEPFLVLKTARAGPRLFAHFLPKSCAIRSERLPSTMRGNPILGHMLWIDVCPSVCLSVFRFRHGSVRDSAVPDTLRNLGFAANRSLKRGWILFRWLVDGVVFCVASCSCKNLTSTVNRIAPYWIRILISAFLLS